MRPEAAAPEIRPMRRRALLVGVLALSVAGLAGVLSDPEAFRRAYLVAFLYPLGIGVGALGVLLVYHLTGGQWGAATERLLGAAALTVPWMALAFVPLALWLPALYEWSRPEAVAAHPLLAHKRPYLNGPFFLARAAVYFAVWGGLAWLLDRRSRARDVTGDPRETLRLQRLAAGGAVAYAFTVSFAAIDWIMSLEPRWYSTVYGGMIGVGWMLSAFTFAIWLAMLLRRRPLVARVLTDKVRIDLGNLLLSFTVLWTYLQFVQFFIIWAANIPEEVEWYARRLGHGWQALAVFLAVAQFLVPLGVLLFRGLKARPRVMLGLTGLLLLGHWVSTLWTVAPAFHPEGLALGWLDVAVSAGLAGLWAALYLTVLARHPLVAVGAPDLPPEAEYARP